MIFPIILEISFFCYIFVDMKIAKTTTSLTAWSASLSYAYTRWAYMVWTGYAGIDVYDTRYPFRGRYFHAFKNI